MNGAFLGNVHGAFQFQHYMMSIQEKHFSHPKVFNISSQSFANGEPMPGSLPNRTKNGLRLNIVERSIVEVQKPWMSGSTAEQVGQ